MNDKTVRAALKAAKKEDEKNPVVVYVKQHPRDPLVSLYFCRVCGPRELEIVPLRADQIGALPLNPVCETCAQPCLRS